MPPVSLIVSVEQSDAVAVVGASLTITPSGTADARPLEEGPAGQYAIAGVPPGDYTLRLTGRGFLTDSYAISLTPGRRNLSQVMGRRGERYYYASGFKIYFRPVLDRFLVAAYGPAAAAAIDRVATERGIRVSAVSERPDAASEQSDVGFRVLTDPSGAVDPASIRAVTSELEAEGLRVIPARVVQRGGATPHGLTEELIVQFDPDVTEPEARDMARAAGLEVVRPVLSAPNLYLLRSPDGPAYELLDTAERLLSGRVIHAEPELVMQLEVDRHTPNDPLFDLTTHLPLINGDQAWADAGQFLGGAQRGGSPDICIAVLDPQGVTPNHPDLTAPLSDGNPKLVTSFNFGAMGPEGPIAVNQDHGTQCAGTATAALDNNLGIAGVAPNCRLIGARVPGVATGALLADTFLWAAGIDNGNTTPNFPPLPSQPADVISNSWGANNAPLSTVLRTAFDRITDNGRGGRGCVVTFSTGNLGYVPFGNVRLWAAYDRNIAVGASVNVNPTSPVNSNQPDPSGNSTNIAVTVDTRALYSPFGPEMDIVAPSHTCYSGSTIVDATTSTVRVGRGDIDGCAGPAICDDYATSFGGTSHASPTIAGAAALVLSAFPILTWAEVIAILRSTAARIDAQQTDPIGRYVDLDGDGVAEFSQWYGYGRVDVSAAVTEAAKRAVATYLAWT